MKTLAVAWHSIDGLLKTPINRPVAILLFAVALIAIILGASALTGGLSAGTIVMAVYGAWGAVGLGIEATRPPSQESPDCQTAVCKPLFIRCNAVLGTWYLVSVIVAAFVMYVVVS